MAALNFVARSPPSVRDMVLYTQLSAPYNPKSNSLTEAGVKSVKNILRKCYETGSNPDTVLYEWRNGPRSDGYSPAQLLFGRFASAPSSESSYQFS